MQSQKKDSILLTVVLVFRKVFDFSAPFVILYFFDLLFLGNYTRLISFFLIVEAIVNLNIRIPLATKLSLENCSIKRLSLVKNGFKIELFSSIICSLVFVILFFLLKDWLQISFTFFLAFSLIIHAFLNVQGVALAILSTTERNYIIQIVETIFALLCFVSIFLVDNAEDLFSLFICYFSLTRLLLTYIAMKVEKFQIDFSWFDFKFKRMSAIWSAHLQTSLTSLSLFGEGIVIPLILSPNYLGLFKIVRTLSTTLISFSQPIQSLFYKYITNSFSSNDLLAIKRINYSSKLLFFIQIIFWLVVFLNFEEINSLFNVDDSGLNYKLAFYYYLPNSILLLGIYFLPYFFLKNLARQIVSITLLMVLSYYLTIFVSQNIIGLIFANFTQHIIWYLTSIYYVNKTELKE